jgi:RsiW-degrading membrane proteinase PrsW (M82 family)
MWRIYSNPDPHGVTKYEEDNKHKDILIHGQKKKLHESQVYLLTCTIIEEICKILYLLTIYNNEEKVQPWNSM